MASVKSIAFGLIFCGAILHGQVPVANGGTGASTVAGALSNLGLQPYGTLTTTDFCTYVSGTGIVCNSTVGTVTAVSIATANGFQGTSSGGATPALTINVDSSHVLPVNTGAATNFLTQAGTYAVPAGTYTLPSTVVQTNQANTYGAFAQNFASATLTMASTYTVGAFTITQPGATGTLALTSQLPATLAAVTHKFFTSYTAATGLFTQAQPAFTDVSGSATCAQLPALTGYVTTSAGSCATSLGSTSIVGGIIGGYSGGINASNPRDFFSFGATNTIWPIFPVGFYLSNFSINISTALSANELYQIYSQHTFGGFEDPNPILSLSPSLGTGNAYNSAASPIPVAAWSGVNPFFGANTFLGANAGVAGMFSAEVLGSSIQPVAWSGGLGGSQASTVALSTTVYTGFSAYTTQQTSGNEALAGVVIPFANGATMTDMVTQTSGAQSATGSLTTTLRVNGATPGTTLTNTIAASAAAGIYPDLTDTVTLSQGQWVDLQIANAATATSAGIPGVVANLTPVAPATALLIFPVAGVAVNNTFYGPFIRESSATELVTRGPVPRASTIVNLYCIYTNPPTVASTMTLYMDGVSQGIVVNFPTTGSGVQFAHGTGTVTTAGTPPFNGVDIKYAQSSGTAATVGSCSAEVD